MTFRDKLADWISCGKLTREIERAAECRDLFHKYYDIASGYELALSKIAEQETPAANATVKRMARIARDVLV